jgi:murein DD-endopeptidase MepM/ murein hydrolase activator NlpD
MLGFVRGLGLGLLLIGLGWLGGSIYPAPQAVTGPIASRVPNLARRLGIDDVTLERLSAFMSRDQLSSLRHDATAAASAAGEAIMIEAVVGPVERQADEIGAAATGPLAFEAQLALCPAMSVSNAPAADANRLLRNYASVVNVNGVRLATAPTIGACLSSAFGARNGRMHKGIDLHSRDGGPILAAAAGRVVERKYRDDYGNMLLIDHGHNVFTRYAHLSSFASGVVEGAQVNAGQQLGLMGNTASYRIPVHLHYELLLGDYNNPRGSFGLTPRSPFEFPRAG